MGTRSSEFWTQANLTDERQYPSHLALTIQNLDISFELQSMECNKHSLWVIQTKKTLMLFAVILTVFHQESGLSHTTVHNCEAINLTFLRVWFRFYISPFFFYIYCYNLGEKWVWQWVCYPVTCREGLEMKFYLGFLPPSPSPSFPPSFSLSLHVVNLHLVYLQQEISKREMKSTTGMHRHHLFSTVALCQFYSSYRSDLSRQVLYKKKIKEFQ